MTEWLHTTESCLGFVLGIDGDAVIEVLLSFSRVCIGLPSPAFVVQHDVSIRSR